MEKFLEIYGTLPRAGPGANALTRRAFSLLDGLSGSPRILDVGCGPGMQTVELLRISDARVVALDLLPGMLDRARALAEAAGVSDRLELLQQDMKSLDFPPSSFDVIWAEGSIYVLGFEAGLKAFKPLVKAGGYIAVSEVVWLKDNPPASARALWAEYPEIASVEEKLGVIKRQGLELVDYFVFPSSAWTEQYYDPMQARIAEKAPEWKGDPEGEAVLQEAVNEISVFRQCSDYYSYAFFVMRVA